LTFSAKNLRIFRHLFLLWSIIGGSTELFLARKKKYGRSSKQANPEFETSKSESVTMTPPDAKFSTAQKLPRLPCFNYLQFIFFGCFKCCHVLFRNSNAIM
jgi:hypothetical protein